MAFHQLSGMKYLHLGIKTSIILKIGHIFIFQKLELLTMVLRVLKISVLGFGKLYQHI